MRIGYDAQSDSLSLVFAAGEIETSREIVPGVVVNLGRDGQPISVELLSASQRVGRDGMRSIEIDLRAL